MRLNAVQTRTCVASGSVGLSNPNPRAEHVRVPVKRPRRANAYRYNRSELNSADQRPHKAEEMDLGTNNRRRAHSVCAERARWHIQRTANCQHNMSVAADSVTLLANEGV